MDWDSFVNVWAIAAGGLEPPAEVPDEMRQAASVLLGLPEGGLMERWPGWGASRLQALGGDPWQGLKALPTDREAREAFFRTVFGTRKRVVVDLGLPTEGEGALPRSQTTPPDAKDAPPAATARRLVAWCRDREVEAEVVDGPFVGQDLTTWDPRALALVDEMLAEEAVTLRLTFPRHRMQILVPRGRENPWDAAQCVSLRPQCETQCPLYGRGVCAKYRVGVGWGFEEKARARDPRRIDEIPAYEQPHRVSDFVGAVQSSRRPSGALASNGA